MLNIIHLDIKDITMIKNHQCITANLDTILLSANLFYAIFILLSQIKIVKPQII